MKNSLILQVYLHLTSFNGFKFKMFTEFERIICLYETDILRGYLYDLSKINLCQ